MVAVISKFVASCCLCVGGAVDAKHGSVQSSSPRYSVYMVGCYTWTGNEIWFTVAYSNTEECNIYRALQLGQFHRVSCMIGEQ
jgi:hypothetical protein